MGRMSPMERTSGARGETDAFCNAHSPTWRLVTSVMIIHSYTRNYAFSEIEHAHHPQLRMRQTISRQG